MVKMNFKSFLESLHNSVDLWLFNNLFFVLWSFTENELKELSCFLDLICSQDSLTYVLVIYLNFTHYFVESIFAWTSRFKQAILVQFIFKKEELSLL